MVLVIDVGNTNIVLGVYEKEHLLGSWRMTTVTKRTSDEYGIFIVTLLEKNHIFIEKVTDVIISSVVPDIMYHLENGVKKYFDVEPMIIGPGVKTGISIRMDNPKSVGADRIVDIVAAYNIYGGPAIVVDFGTATTFDVVTEKGEFCVAVTTPGIQITADAMWTHAAQLPKIKIKKPDTILAKNTVSSMQAGLIYGYIGQVEYIIKKLKEEMKIQDMKVIATGGLARVIYNETDSIDIYDRQLTLKGLRIINEKNKEDKKCLK